MSKHQSLQAMIHRAISGSMDKTAADKGSTEKKVKNLVSYEKKEHGHIPTPAEEANECHDKTASAHVDDDYVEKLASSVDWIAANLDKIDIPNRGVLEKAAEDSGSPVGPGKGPGSLEVEKSIGGEQSHKKDKPRTEDASASQAGSPLSTGGLPESKTQMENDMNHAPGGGNVKPTASYPDKGPLVAGPTTKHASPLANAIMRKLAGEANIDGGGTSSPLAGMGQLSTTDSSQSSPSQSGDPVSGYGNQGRRLIQSNQAAINATKRDAKGPQKTQLKEVLEEPALNSGTDSTLEQNLRNTGKAGVKIAGARIALEKVAAAGCTCTNINGECRFCRMTAKLAAVAKGRESQKHANAMMGGGMGGGGMGGMSGGGAMPSTPPMTSMADAGAGADGCICAGAGECKVCKLKAALAAMKAQGAGGMPEGGIPVEKDSNMGMGASPPGGIY